MEGSAAFERIARKALDLLRGSLGGRNLQEALRFSAEFEGEDPVAVSDLVTRINHGPAGDPIRLQLHQRLGEWDAMPEAAWAQGTQHQTPERRRRIYELLELPPDAAETFDRHFPPRLLDDPGFEISTDFERWYDWERADAGFYWPRYRDHLRTVERWGIGVEDLARATFKVVERLGRPERREVVQSRGLVVGYVQSGKTANFMGVIARAIDAGYRLIIVLAGTTNLLRGQTQRRVDKQLVGRELLTGIAAEEQYPHDPDWDRFISYGGAPGELGSVDINRLTGLGIDYRRLRGGLPALQFEQHERSLPLNAPENLIRMPARLVVAKKNRAPLDSLRKDLEDVRAAGVPLNQVPALIIDDESDQASINTRSASRSQIRSRTAINRAITDLLNLLPRAQYVGYTATPFANVFVDPNDEIGIYPRDFILGLDRPKEYMGSSEYHDFGETREGFASNERAYVRSVRGHDRPGLSEAIDLYLLTGAIKLFREEHECPLDTKHHTMLVHTSQRTDDHRAMAATIRLLIDQGGYEDGTGEDRLRDRLNEDLRPVSQERSPELPFPEDFAALRPYVARCYQRLQEDGEPVLIVNGLRENEELSPDFDRDSVWRIIVGGTKLSRGYTVEGLTVSYYRRPTGAADTLMQMGRWFGFRRNYEDLMRLYIGREEGPSRRPIDLYRAFEAVCRDELDLRRELRMYQLPEHGEPVTPLRVPPLVSQHLPTLRPTAPNKMYNATIRSENFGGRQIAPTLAPESATDTAHNEGLCRDLVSGISLANMRLGPSGNSFGALVGEVAPDRMLTFLEGYRWSRPGVLSRGLSFLGREMGDPRIATWSLVFPLLAEEGEAGSWPLNGGERVSVIERYRDPDTARFNVYTASVHVDAARAIAVGKALSVMTAETQALAEPDGRAAALMYAVKALGRPNDPVTIGFALFPPPNEIPEKVRWGVNDPARRDEPIVERAVDA